MYNPSERGFTLTELSIVIVIIGLLVGGIMGGSIVMKNSELKSVGSDMQMYKMAVNTFHQQYFGLPGDIANSEDFWGTDSAGCPDGGGTGTCNGDADGNWSTDGKEGLRGWQQLGLADIIPDDYAGALTSGDLVTDTHIPSSKIAGGGYVMRNLQGYSKTLNALEFGAVVAGGGSRYVDEPLLTSEDAIAIDIKFDDGVANTGDIFGIGTGCTGQANTHATGADYDLSLTDPGCTLNYWGIQP